MIFTPEEWLHMHGVVGTLRYNLNGDALDPILDRIADIEDVCPGVQYRCHICGIPWGH